MRLLLAKNPDPLLAYLMTSLREAGYAVDIAANGADALWRARNVSYDMIILDTKLPSLAGLGGLQNLRAKDRTTRILLLIASGAMEENVKELLPEADGCLEKSDTVDELLTRIKSLCPEAPAQDWTEIQIADLTINLSTQRVALAGNNVHLIPREFRLLTLLALNANRIVTRSEIQVHMYGQDSERKSNIIDNIICQLRKKLLVVGSQLDIQTKLRLGYCIVTSKQGCRLD